MSNSVLSDCGDGWPWYPNSVLSDCGDGWPWPAAPGPEHGLDEQADGSSEGGKEESVQHDFIDAIELVDLLEHLHEVELVQREREAAGVAGEVHAGPQIGGGQGQPHEHQPRHRHHRRAPPLLLPQVPAPLRLALRSNPRSLAGPLPLSASLLPLLVGGGVVGQGRQLRLVRQTEVLAGGAPRRVLSPCLQTGAPPVGGGKGGSAVGAVDLHGHQLDNQGHVDHRHQQ